MSRDPEATDAAVDALARLWVKHRPTNARRLLVVERAADAAADGRLSEHERSAAARAAHKLVGALGTFGLGTATHWARAAESELASPSPRPAALVAAVRELRRIFDASAGSGPAAICGARTGPPSAELVTSDDGLARALGDASALAGVVLTRVPPGAATPLAGGCVGLVDLRSLRPAAGPSGAPTRYGTVIALGEDGGAARMAAAHAGADVFVPLGTPSSAVVDAVRRAAQQPAPLRVVVVSERLAPSFPRLGPELTSAGHDVTAVAHGHDLWDRRLPAPDVVVADAVVAGDLRRAVRADVRLVDVAVVAVVAAVDAGVGAAVGAPGDRAGADDEVVAVAGDPASVVAHLRGIAERRHLRDVRRAARATPTVAPADPVRWDQPFVERHGAERRDRAEEHVQRHGVERGDREERVGHGPVGDVDVLIVEDDPGVAEVVIDAVGRIGATSLYVDDGAAAVRFLVDEGHRATVVLLDIDLPALDGFGVLRALRAADVLAHTSVIVLSSRASGPDTMRALSLGAADHLAKPFSPRIVSRYVRQALKDRRWAAGAAP